MRNCRVRLVRCSPVRESVGVTKRAPVYSCTQCPRVAYSSSHKLTRLTERAFMFYFLHGGGARRTLAVQKTRRIKFWNSTYEITNVESVFGGLYSRALRYSKDAPMAV